ncbi:uncharacterized protein LOC143570343 [Bidens hawaiensis]|uniref:uncharacterized protein LOC143570343 n=1 Tax=Bidens hawaiensis TaxID=980011 RepID=UPI00404A5817
MKKDKMLGKNRIEDVRWLCSLSKSELDVLVSLKKLAIRAQYSILKNKRTRKVSIIKRKSLSKKVDLKMLRDLSFVLMQVVKERLDDNAQIGELRVESSNLAKYEINKEFREMGAQELMGYIRPDRKKKRIFKLFGIEDVVIKKKRRVSNGRKTVAID